MDNFFVTISVSGIPRPKQSFKINRDTGAKYIPTRTKVWAEAIGWRARQEMMGKSPYQKAVSVELQFTLLETKSKIDVDNLAKNALDGMKGIVYEDDDQVHRLLVEKRYTKNEREVPPGMIAIVRSL